jgi:hypothetical protein
MFQKAIRKVINSYLHKMRKWEKKHPILNTLIVLVGVIFLWRGIWGLLDTYFLPNNPLLSNGIGTLIGFAILLLDDFELDEV